MRHACGHSSRYVSVLLIALAALLTGCAGGSGRLVVDSSPSDLRAYAIPARVWYKSKTLPQDIIDNPSAYAKYKYGQLTPTKARAFPQGTYFVVVTDGKNATFTEQQVYPSKKALTATLDLAS